ncbi:hypothetical protein [uncultured Dysosmobacter sp.]|uniref:hypothetical protein n=1 Tax=uncultured Dysosmobacter sp. TaxID=2591384 RepID=UPI00262FF9D1|nr:hypothetical protein [uncultured Dysosmobacter sp.]
MKQRSFSVPLDIFAFIIHSISSPSENPGPFLSNSIENVCVIMFPRNASFCVSVSPFLLWHKARVLAEARALCCSVAQKARCASSGIKFQKNFSSLKRSALLKSIPDRRR